MPFENKHLPEAGEPEAAAVLEELSRLEKSEVFRYSERMCRLLRHLVDYSLKNPEGQPKEFPIALEVFDKPETFDARVDPIVRVEASRLRAKLRAYYEGEGGANPVSILLPKRGYRPIFQLQQANSAVPVGHWDAFAPVSPSWASSVLVLPFADLSSTQTEEYFCDGITEELINSLARMKGVNVVSRTSAFRFKGTAADVREIAHSLGVTAVVEGSVRRDGDSVRVSVQLLSARDGFPIWAERYAGNSSQGFRLQDDIARAVAEALKVKLQVQAGPLTDTGSGDADSTAFHLYLKGLHAWNRRTPESFRQSVALLEQAAAAGPTSAQTQARIFAKLAHSHLGLYLSNYVEPREALAAAASAASRALAAMPEWGEALAVEAFVECVRDWNWAHGKATFERALEEEPNNATIHEWYAMVSLLPAGRFVEAETRMRRALDLDPVSAVLHCRRGVLLYFQGRLDEAIAELELAVSLDPGFDRGLWYLGRGLTLAGRYERAREVLEKARRNSAGNMFRPGILGHCLAVSGHTTEARALLDELRQEKRHWVSPFCIAEILTGLKDYEGAMEALEVAADARAFPVVCLGSDPVFNPMRQEPAFLRLLERIGLAVTVTA